MTTNESAEKEARSLHKVVRAMHDGYCPQCSKVFPASSVQFEKSIQCPSCGFHITHEEVRATMLAFAPVMERDLAVFLRWRGERQTS
jgi:DNA-directed RNA polymerase subunit RPC12/RpoP